VFAAWLLGERIGVRGWAAFAAMTGGLALLMTDGFGGWPGTGDWLLLATVPLIGLSDAWSKRTLGGVDAMTMAAGRQLFGFAFLAAALLVLDPRGLTRLGATWPWVFGAGGLAGIFAIAFYVAVQRGAVSLAAALLALAPVLTALLEWLTLGNAPGGWQLLGLGVVVAGSLAVASMHGRDP
jgi:drug/metabolite transporter (DMT)-like permease